ncbi:acyl-CoA thioesterase [Castellaniella defragrans]|uniref:4-hydroxybenzoyl-CoA thioesterase n=1 Tax=Castellaniella defragrans TaxID=75697 RepID=A0A7W9TL35_CASDE|nr:thioesterase family protein [Castellaniella defragrans]KAB0599805.1 acyl-CoA thioesterase [Castellaniella defragrans]MBB6082710.1 4-hydroxybenzoyl-CoA thioesterase [Castellaniella defragrans]
MNAAPAASSRAACFARDYPIRFSHCDPAGIVFFPQYLVLFNQLVEDWFNEGLGISYAHLLGPRRIGLPIVRLECDFRAIGRMGETLRFALAVERVGGKSLTLALEASGDGVLRVASRQVLVFTDLETHRAIALPEDVRAALAAGAPAA